MSESDAVVTTKRRISPVWLVPIFALIIGAWLVIITVVNQGPEVTIVFATAEGIEAGKTAIKLHSVDIGIVETVGLADDLERVVVTARLDQAAAPLLRDDTQFWVVRPRIGAGGISGLGTLLSGGFIQLSPGTGKAGQREYLGSEVPPVTAVGTPGLKIRLESDDAGSIGTGDPILYKSFTVGRIESASFNSKSQRMEYVGFVEAPHDELVTSATRFWNMSGLTVKAGANGVEVGMGSIESLLQGGVAMGLPEGITPGGAVDENATFQLYSSYTDVIKNPYRVSIPYVLKFAQSVRGLTPGAPVEYRGIPAGRVDRILMREVAGQIGGDEVIIPVLVQLEPGRIELPDTAEGSKLMSRAVETGVTNGLRATLTTGSLLTGSLYVSLDMYPDSPAATVEEFAGHRSIPTIAGGLDGIQHKVGSLLDKLNALPLDRAVVRAEKLLTDLDTILAAPKMQELPDSLESTLSEVRTTLASFSAEAPLQQRLVPTIDELDRTLSSLRRFIDKLEETPNALIFSRDVGDDPQPPAGSQ